MITIPLPVIQHIYYTEEIKTVLLFCKLIMLSTIIFVYWVWTAITNTLYWNKDSCYCIFSELFHCMYSVYFFKQNQCYYQISECRLSKKFEEIRNFKLHNESIFRKVLYQKSKSFLNLFKTIRSSSFLRRKRCEMIKLRCLNDISLSIGFNQLNKWTFSLLKSVLEKDG